MLLDSHLFTWDWDPHNQRWVGEHAERISYDYVWMRLTWPCRLMVKRLFDAYLDLPPEFRGQEPPEGFSRQGIYVPSTCHFVMAPIGKEPASVYGSIYLPST